VRRNFRVSRSFFESRDKGLRPAHEKQE
jgi:hypothetical protein